jgi:hypothetical protein
VDGGQAVGHRELEATVVAVLGVDVEGVALVAGAQRVRAPDASEGAAQPRDVDVQTGRRPVRRARRPDVVDDPGGRDGVAGLQGEQRQDLGRHAARNDRLRPLGGHGEVAQEIGVQCDSRRRHPSPPTPEPLLGW